MATPRKRPAGRLGKGLSALMTTPVAVEPVEPVATGTQSAAQPEESTAGAGRPPTPPAAEGVPRGTDRRVVELPLDQLRPNPLQPRRAFDEASLGGLAVSIRAEGVIQPITARPTPDGVFEIVAGERRWRAAAMAELKTVPVLVHPLDDADTARWALIENVQREDLNPIDRAEALQRLCDTQGLRHGEVGDAVGLSRSAVTNLIRLLTLAPPVRTLVVDGHLQMGHARALAGVNDPALQENLARRAVAEGWSVRAIEQAVKKAGTAPATAATPARTPEVRAAWLRDLESQLEAGLQTPVRVSPGRRRGTGTVTIEYRTLEDFDRLVGQLGVRTG